MSYFYIASPYTHVDLQLMRRRYEKVVDFTSWLIEQYRYNVFSPIAHSHPLCQFRNLRPEYEFWAELDRIMIAPSAGLFVLQIDGWAESRGMAEEIKFATELKKPVFYSKSVWPHYDHLY